MDQFEFRPFDENTDLELVLDWLIKTKEAVSMAVDVENERKIYFDHIRSVQSREAEYSSILLADGEMVGYLSAFPLTRYPDMAWLDFCYIVPEWRGTEASNFLVERMVKTASDNNCSKIRLSVHSDNARGIGFYRKNGWKVIKTRDDSTHLMEKAL